MVESTHQKGEKPCLRIYEAVGPQDTQGTTVSIPITSKFQGMPERTITVALSANMAAMHQRDPKSITAATRSNETVLNSRPFFDPTKTVTQFTITGNSICT